MQLFCVQSVEQRPRMFLPVTRSANAADVLILECLLTSNLRSVTFTKKLLYPILEFALRNNVGAARGNHESSITNLSIASTSGDTLQTAAQKSSTILTEFTCFFCTAIHSIRPRQAHVTRGRATESRFPLSIDRDYGLGNFPAKVRYGFTEGGHGCVSGLLVASPWRNLGEPAARF